MSVFRDISHAIGAARNGWAHRPSLVTRADEFRGMQQAAYRTAIEAAFKSRRAKNEWYPGGDGETNVGNYYPGAELGRYRNDWITRIVTSTNLTRLSYRTLCSRSEHAYRTNSNIKRAIELIKTLTIGSGALPFAMVKNSDGTPAEAINKALTEAIWPRFNDQGMRVGSQDLTVLEGQGIEMESMAQLGSVIRQKKPSKKGSCVPFAYTWVKPYRLNFATTSNRIIATARMGGPSSRSCVVSPNGSNVAPLTVGASSSFGAAVPRLRACRLFSGP